MGPIEPEMRERNREILAARMHWPEGALEKCRELEAKHPAFVVWWSDRPVRAFYAQERMDRLIDGAHLQDESAGELDARLTQWEADNPPPKPFRPLWNLL